MRIIKWLAIGALVVVVVVGGLVAHTLYGKPLKVGWFYERVFAEYAIDDPQLLTSLGMLPPWLDWYNDELSDASLAREAKLEGKVRDDLATLRAYDRESMDAAGQLDRDVLEYFLQMADESAGFHHHDYPANPLFGFQNGLPEFMATQHRIRDRDDVEDYIARLKAFPLAFEQRLEAMRVREQEGIMPPRFVVEKVLDGARAFIAKPPEDNILYSSLVERLDKAGEGTLAGDDREALLAETRAAIRDQVYPAYQGLIDYYADLLPRARCNNGVWELPRGAEFYAHAVRQHTTTDMTPDEIHALGLAEVARIEQEMDAILRSEGMTEGSIGTRVQALSARPEQLYPDSDAGREAILADFQTIIDEIDQGLDGYFGIRPKQHVIVKRVPEFREKTAPGAYYETPSMDGVRPGAFSVNLREVADIPKFGMRTLAYHEAIPGHHFQSAIQQELTGVPTFRKLLPFTAFSEGWALYAERLAWEIGFQDEPLNNLGRLQGEMMRAVRLVVDSGMHHKRWTREQSIDYMVDKTGMGLTDVTAEIERYLVMPGQALAYKVGMLKILELREKAREALGDRFRLADFHDVVLSGGDLPLELLERRIDAWIAEKKAGQLH